MIQMTAKAILIYPMKRQPLGDTRADDISDDDDDDDDDDFGSSFVVFVFVFVVVFVFVFVIGVVVDCFGTCGEGSDSDDVKADGDGGMMNNTWSRAPVSSCLLLQLLYWPGCCDDPMVLTLPSLCGWVG